MKKQLKHEVGRELSALNGNDLALTYEKALKEVYEVVLAKARYCEIVANFPHNKSIDDKNKLLQEVKDIMQYIKDKTLEIKECQYVIHLFLEGLNNCEIGFFEGLSIKQEIKKMEKLIKDHIDIDTIIRKSNLEEIIEDRAKEEIDIKEVSKK
jgi:hypothetical protein